MEHLSYALLEFAYVCVYICVCISVFVCLLLGLLEDRQAHKGSGTSPVQKHTYHSCLLIYSWYWTPDKSGHTGDRKDCETQTGSFILGCFGTAWQRRLCTGLGVGGFLGSDRVQQMALGNRGCLFMEELGDQHCAAGCPLPSGPPERWCLLP